MYICTCVCSGLQTLPLYGNYQVVYIVLGKMHIGVYICACVCVCVCARTHARLVVCLHKLTCTPCLVLSDSHFHDLTRNFGSNL